MRKVLAVMLVAVFASLGAHGNVIAQVLAGISGQAVDAGGRAIAYQRVELVQAGQVIQTTTTGARGEWSFTSILAGEYVVRMNIGGKIAGIRVTVPVGHVVSNTLIVAPSAAAPSTPFLAALGLLGGLLAGAAVAAAVIITAVQVTGS